MIKSQLDQELQCSICHEMFRDPRMLPCQHTFCLECLESVSKLTKDGKTLDCSLCKRAHNLPIQDGVKGFPENMLMNTLLDLKIKAIAPLPSDTSPLVVDKITGMEYPNEDMIKVQSTNTVDSRRNIRGARQFIEIPVTDGAFKREDFEIDWFITPNYKIGLNFESLLFLGYFWIAQSVLMIFTGCYFYDEDQGQEDGSLVTISLLIEGSILLLLALTFPLFYRLSLCCQKHAPVLARFIKNIGWVLSFLEMVAFVFAFFCGTVFVLEINGKGKIV